MTLRGGAQPFPDEPLPATPETLEVGLPLGSEPLTLDAQTLALMTKRLDLAPGDWPQEVVHPFIFLNISTMHQHHSLSFPTPGVHAATEVQMLAPAKLGETVESVGRISKLYERKGHQFFESEQLIRTVDGRSIAMVRNTVIYRIRDAVAAS